MMRFPGTGAYKLGANYAPCVVAQKEAAQKGYVQNLWLYGPEHYLTEVFQQSFSHSSCKLTFCGRWAQ
jgi:branched-subunit amino acid aminotransferase/4-amino-4-deoxychorismate lyase